MDDDMPLGPRAPLPRFFTALAVAAGLGLCLISGPGAQAQGNPFSAAVIVNDSAVTYYEIEQRQRFLRLLNAPPDVIAAAQETLIEERLQMQDAERRGVTPTPEAVAAGMTEFAGRANLEARQFVQAIGEQGIAPETFRDFVTAGIAWRNVLRAVFGPNVQVTEEEIDRVLQVGASGTGFEAPVVTAVEYATVLIPGGQTEGARAEALALRDRLDSCDDLFGVLPGGFTRETLPIEQVPPDIAVALSGLDANEVSLALTRDGGAQLVFLMLCGRSSELPEGSRDEIRDRLFSQRLQSYAEGYLAELRAAAIILDP